MEKDKGFDFGDRRIKTNPTSHIKIDFTEIKSKVNVAISDGEKKFADKKRLNDKLLGSAIEVKIRRAEAWAKEKLIPEIEKRTAEGFNSVEIGTVPLSEVGGVVQDTTMDMTVRLYICCMIGLITTQYLETTPNGVISIFSASWASYEK